MCEGSQRFQLLSETYVLTDNIHEEDRNLGIRINEGFNQLQSVTALEPSSRTKSQFKEANTHASPMRTSSCW